ncbi:hypothetical protein AJ80_09149 [Polytolypa hystricis UAMH7299]|uniref:Thymidylate kinase n=1 Tax=Polytolypa hystricis (strain UAMH7299) TaxID=1447883 RepID=A0A2B7WVV6_POLH7|nr:hypothetical protein AJ80_09149 [Polytolypa hystricis UAMH7299]
MAALTQSVSPPRQPFGIIGASRLRVLDSMKNHQNGLTANSRKRRHESESSDTENVDPSLKSSAKRKRTTLDDGAFKKPVNFINTPVKSIFVQPSSVRLQTPISRPKDLHIPKSAPLRAPAGRSPKSKVGKAFSRRSIGSYKRVDPPSFAKHLAPRAPFSIADALNGTFSPAVSAKPLPLEKPRSKTWDFEIYVDTEQDEMSNLMEHSTCVLDISDDEEKAAVKDDRGKENIPPPEFTGLAVSMNRASSQPGSDTRNVEMTDEPRSALGELDVSHFIAKGEDASKVVVVSEEDQETDELAGPVTCSTYVPTQATSCPAPKDSDTTPAAPTLLSHEAISAFIKSAASLAEAAGIPLPEDQGTVETPAAPEIDIWESESAAEEAAASVNPEGHSSTPATSATNETPS